jgi:hypothetical protein
MDTTTQRPVTQTDIDRAREVLERANFKLGKARSRAIMSSAQASADAQDLQACLDGAANAENEFAELAERFVSPPATAVEPDAHPVTFEGLGTGGFVKTDDDPVGLDGQPLRDAFRPVV